MKNIKLALKRGAEAIVRSIMQPTAMEMSIEPGVYQHSVPISVLYDQNDLDSHLIKTVVRFRIQVLSSGTQLLADVPTAKYVRHGADGRVTQEQITSWESMAQEIFYDNWSNGLYRLRRTPRK